MLDMKVSGLHGKPQVVFAGIEGSIVNADDLTDEEDDPTIKDGTTTVFGELAVPELAEDLKASIERIEMEYMLAKSQVEKERTSKIAQLDKKRRADMLVLLGGCTQSGFNTGKPVQRSSLDAAANLSDCPSTSRQGDTRNVSNNDDRLLSSSRDLELATARDLDGDARLNPEDGGQAQEQENQTKEKSDSHPDVMELPSDDVAQVNSERREANKVATGAPQSVEAVCVEDTNKNLLMK